MSHSSARICAEHKIVQRQCRCPEPITSVIEEECKHGEESPPGTPYPIKHLYWNGTKIVRENPLDASPNV